MSLAQQLVAPQLKELEPYQSARRIGGHGQVYLNANEAALPPFGMPEGETWHRYPDFLPTELAAAYASYAGVHAEQTLAVRGADEAIDLLIRAYCEPHRDAIRVQTPTYSMYEFVADAHAVGVDSIALDAQFDLDTAANAAQHCEAGRLKIVFICHPNNPTGNRLSRDRIAKVAEALRGTALVVIDEAYIEYCPADSVIDLIETCPNVVIIRTLSKAFALAAIRVGVVIAAEDVLAELRKLVAPYPMPDDSARIALRALSGEGVAYMTANRDSTTSQREACRQALLAMPHVAEVYDSATNFLLVRFADAERVMRGLLDAGIVIRDQRHFDRLSDHLRISIGNPSDMQILLSKLEALG